ncbi:MAG: DNA alkylation repair protein [bacterium]|nr:DNA alkylation repair protein [bacterium]
MAEAFKEQIGDQAVARIAKAAGLGRAFVRAARRGLDELELKARVRHIAAALHEHLPADFGTAVAQLVDGLPSALPSAEGVASGFWLWPLCQYVEEFGLDEPELALDAMHALTQRFSCEFAIRPYIESHSERTFARLHRWVEDPSLHVRRLVSEGTRPLLPWGRRLTALQKDPAPVIPLLDRLRDDPEEYVRRSVANHLNDISKGHPELVVDLAKAWLRDGQQTRERLVRHALRTLVKQGYVPALRALGIAAPRLEADLKLTPRRATIGGAIELKITLRSKAGKRQRLVIDYAVHHRRQNGTLSPKVFKWSTRELGKGEEFTLTKRHSLRPVTTRRYYPGKHAVELLVNGESFGRCEFDLRA